MKSTLRRAGRVTSDTYRRHMRVEPSHQPDRRVEALREQDRNCAYSDGRGFYREPVYCALSAPVEKITQMRAPPFPLFWRHPSQRITPSLSVQRGLLAEAASLDILSPMDYHVILEGLRACPPVEH